MSKPYVYKLEGKNNEFYFGVRWSYVGDPIDDIWKEYFTSSSLIKEIIFTSGITYFTPSVIKVFESKEEALDYEYNLIKNNFKKDGCLNRAMGKCTIWDNFLKERVSNSIKAQWQNEEYKKNIISKISGENHPRFGLKPWRNINSSIDSWKKVIHIYNDYLNENWDFNKYGFGRAFLKKRYNICQGTARCFIKLIKNNWNPLLDSDYLLFLNEHTRVS